MTTPLQQLTEERERLSKRLQFMNVQSTGRDMLEQRIQEIEKELDRMRLLEQI